MEEECKMSKATLYINGEWIDSTGTERSEVINPATEEIIDTVALSTHEDVDKAVAAAKEAFPAWNTRPVEERIEYMEKLYTVIEKYQQEIADSIIAELGTSRQFAEQMHAPQPLIEMRATLNEIKEFNFEEEKGNTKVINEGYGVVACITPWNYPINQIQRKITPAMLAGNTVVVKPPTNTPLTAILYAKMIEEAGFPKGVFNLVTGSGSDAGDYLTTHPDVSVISFTGSTEVGKEMIKNAAEHIKHVVLELGGKSALVYLKGGDLKFAVKKSLDTVLNNQGQTCTALTRLIVPEDELEEVKQELLDYYKEAVTIGNPSDSDTMVGPMVSEDQRVTVMEYIQTGKEEGAVVLIGGNKIEGKGYYVEPTIFVNVTNDMTIAREEIFGPVLTVITYQTAEEAVEIANDSPYGLSGAVVGPHDAAVEAARQLKTGNIFVNDGDRNPYAPFGGYKQSGLGRENGIYGVKDYLQNKALFL